MSTDDKTEFEDSYDVSKYDHPSVVVDVLIFTIEDEQLKIILVKRGISPYCL